MFNTLLGTQKVCGGRPHRRARRMSLDHGRGLDDKNPIRRTGPRQHLIPYLTPLFVALRELNTSYPKDFDGAHNQLQQVLAVAAGAFVATNLDDIMILTVFFAEAQASARIAGGLKASQVVVGQYLGFTVLVIVSMVGYVVGHFVAPKWIGLLGLVPILIGVKSYVKMCLCPEKEADDGCVDEAQQSNHDSENGELGPVRSGNTQSRSSHPIDSAERDQGDQRSDSHDQASAVSADKPFRANAAVRALKRVMNPGVLRVALLTVANGADNLAIYTPLFAASHRWRICVTLLVFYVMVGVWCLFGWSFVRIPIVARVITSYGDRAVPLLLIGLGVYILIDNDSQTVFGAKPIRW